MVERTNSTNFASAVNPYCHPDLNGQSRAGNNKLSIQVKIAFLAPEIYT